MEVTKREILVSIIIFFILMALGLVINNFIIEGHILEVEKYNKALKINNDPDTFKYVIDTEVGNLLVYGTFNVDKGITLDELKGEYAYIKKEKERYTKHSRRVCDDDGNCHTEYYYSWDSVDVKKYNVDSIKFLDIEFEYYKFSNQPVYSLDLYNNVVDSKKSYVSSNYLYEDKGGIFGHRVGDIRYYYYYTPTHFTGTVFAKAKNKTITNENNGKIYINHSNLQDTLENKKNSSTLINVVFWIIWLFLTGLAIYGYVYLDNDYLED